MTLTAPAVQSTGARHRWAVILAGGDGTRLRSLTRQISGDDRPKQFCCVLGQETLLQQTQRRTARLIPAEQTLLVMTKGHEAFYANQLAEVGDSEILVQPSNRGTAPAILHSLLRLNEIDRDGVVGIFPSDHYFSSDAAFASHMERAYSLAAHSEHLILLGIPPSEPDVEYGWIEPSVYLDPADYVNSAWPLSPVNRFWEKPDQRLAKALMDCGCLWNSFIMVGRVSAFLQSIRLALPNLMAAFESFQLSPSCRSERAELSQLYSMLRPMSFSADVLAARPADLSVLCATGLGWSDLGDPGRVTSVLHQRGMKTQWASVSA